MNEGQVVILQRYHFNPQNINNDQLQLLHSLNPSYLVEDRLSHHHNTFKRQVTMSNDETSSPLLFFKTFKTS